VGLPADLSASGGSLGGGGRIIACPPLAGYKVLTGLAVAVGIYETLKK